MRTCVCVCVQDSKNGDNKMPMAVVFSHQQVINVIIAMYTRRNDKLSLKREPQQKRVSELF